MLTSFLTQDIVFCGPVCYNMWCDAGSFHYVGGRSHGQETTHQTRQMEVETHENHQHQIDEKPGRQAVLRLFLGWRDPVPLGPESAFAVAPGPGKRGVPVLTCPGDLSGQG